MQPVLQINCAIMQINFITSHSKVQKNVQTADPDFLLTECLCPGTVREHAVYTGVWSKCRYLLTEKQTNRQSVPVAQC